MVVSMRSCQFIQSSMDLSDTTNPNIAEMEENKRFRYHKILSAGHRVSTYDHRRN